MHDITTQNNVIGIQGEILKENDDCNSFDQDRELKFGLIGLNTF